MDRPGIVSPQPAQLRARPEVAGIDEKWSIPPALRDKVAKPKNLAVHHKMYKLFLVRFHVILLHFFTAPVNFLISATPCLTQ